MSITVVHNYIEPNHIYCGRGSPLGNPFRMYSEIQRDEVCDKFDDYFYNEVVVVENPVILSELTRIYNIAKVTDVKLGCFCAPKRCHCNTIKRYLDNCLEFGIEP